MTDAIDVARGRDRTVRTDATLAAEAVRLRGDGRSSDSVVAGEVDSVGALSSETRRAPSVRRRRDDDASASASSCDDARVRVAGRSSAG